MGRDELALVTGFRDACVPYDAGMTAALEDADPARRLLTEALAVDPAFDPTQARRAAQTLERPRP